MHDYSGLKTKAEKELGKLAMEENIPVSAWEKINVISSALKNLCKIEMLGDKDSNSYRGGSYDSYAYDNSYEPDYSSRRRDRMGRFARDNGYSERMYSRGSNVMEEMEKLMDEASSEKERVAIRRCLSSLKEG